MDSSSGLSHEANEEPAPTVDEEGEEDFWGSPMAMMRNLG